MLFDDNEQTFELVWDVVRDMQCRIEMYKFNLYSSLTYVDAGFVRMCVNVLTEIRIELEEIIVPNQIPS